MQTISPADMPGLSKSKRKMAEEKWRSARRSDGSNVCSGTLPSYTVLQRKREIGIRFALGAQVGDVLQIVLKQGTKLITLGVIIGICAAFAVTRLMTNLLFGVTARDPLTLFAVAGLLILVSLLACYIPARRATLVDPIVALRYE